MISGALGAWFSLVLGRVALKLGGGGRAGGVIYRGIPADASQGRGLTDRLFWGGLWIGGQLRVEIPPRLSLSVGLEAGYVTWDAVGRINEEREVELTGGWLRATLALGIRIF